MTDAAPNQSGETWGLQLRGASVEPALPEWAGLCLSCGLCASRCPMSGVDGFDPRKLLRLCLLGEVEAAAASRFPWLCTGCGRCTYYCPLGVEMPTLVGMLKGMRERARVPGILHKNVVNALEFGNSPAVSDADYRFVMEDVAAELAGTLPGFEMPIEREGAEYLFFPHPKEVAIDYDDMKWMWTIFHKAQASWTVPGHNWESIDWGYFTGNMPVSRELARRKVEIAQRLGVKTIILPDCGGSSFGCRHNLDEHFAGELSAAGIGYIYIYDLLIGFLREGRLKVDPGRHPERLTYHDSCKHGREALRVFGQGYFEEPRWIIGQVAAGDLVEMWPNRENSFCCGAGGGLYAGPYEKERFHHGRRKVESIRRTGAQTLVVTCSNCRDQIGHGLKRKFGLEAEVKYLWQLVAEALI